MSGRRIDDHSAWMGKGSGGMPLPRETKTKMYSSAEGAGKIADYPDTSEDVKRDQEGGVRKLRSKPMKPGYRY